MGALKMSAHRACCTLLVALLAGQCGLAWGQQRYWYDGQVKRPLWFEPGWEADFSVRGKQAPGPLWLAGSSGSSTAARTPVFREGADEFSRRLALPGGVIVRFHRGQDAVQRQALAVKHGLILVREMGGLGRIWLVEAPIGLASLDLANRLFESGDFEAAAPNWWRSQAIK